jgi:hypothetical protein
MVLVADGERKVFIFSRELYQKHSFGSQFHSEMEMENKSNRKNT